MTREDTLRAAARLLSRNGGATMDEVARAAGISRATLHRQFTGREALVRALEELCLRECEQAIEAARPDEDSALEAVRRIVVETEPSAGLLSFLFTELTEEALHEGWQRIEDRIADVLRRGKESGEIRVDLSTTWLVDALLSLIATGAWAVQMGRLAGTDYRESVLGTLFTGIQGTGERNKP